LHAIGNKRTNQGKTDIRRKKMKATRTYTGGGMTVIEVTNLATGDSDANVTLFAIGASGTDTDDVLSTDIHYYDDNGLIEVGTDTSQANRAIVDIHRVWDGPDFR
jgi:hypothetical protein